MSPNRGAAHYVMVLVVQQQLLLLCFPLRWCVFDLAPLALGRRVHLWSRVVGDCPCDDFANVPDARPRRLPLLGESRLESGVPVKDRVDGACAER